MQVLVSPLSLEINNDNDFLQALTFYLASEVDTMGGQWLYVQSNGVRLTM